MSRTSAQLGSALAVCLVMAACSGHQSEVASRPSHVLESSISMSPSRSDEPPALVLITDQIRQFTDGTYEAGMSIRMGRYALAKEPRRCSFAVLDGEHQLVASGVIVGTGGPQLQLKMADVLVTEGCSWMGPLGGSNSTTGNSEGQPLDGVYRIGSDLSPTAVSMWYLEGANCTWSREDSPGRGIGVTVKQLESRVGSGELLDLTEGQTLKVSGDCGRWDAFSDNW